MRLLTLAVLALGLPAACRPVVRACSSSDRCEAPAACVGGRCEAPNVPPAIAETERMVLVPTRQSYAALGGEAALLLDFDLRGIDLSRVVESHLLLRRPTPATRTVAVHRLTGTWSPGSTAPAERLALLGAAETEARLATTSPDLVRLQLSSDSLRRQAGTGWGVRFAPAPAADVGPEIAEASDDGPRLELYLRQPVH